MFDVLVTHATESKNESIRIKAADRFLFYTMLQPKEGVEESDTSNTEIFAGLTLEEAYKVRELMQPAITELTNELIAKVKQG